jgi:4-hydroxythreonine-4-phosphate dehydrogenase
LSINVGHRRRIAVTLGDPAGVGPELALRVARDWLKDSLHSLILFGDIELLARVGKFHGLACPPVIEPDELTTSEHRVAVLAIDGANLSSLQPGQWSAETGRASYEWVCSAIKSALAKSVDAIVTGPIQKEAWHAAGIDYPGHTELLADLTRTTDYRMMLTSPQISCVLVTTHIPLADVAKRLSSEGVYQSIRLGHQALSRSLRRAARVTVCGLNPHAGENGLFSHDEEERIILPAINRARADGIEVIGPLSPDTAFVPARRQTTDVYICMYHDQGLIPLKALAFDEAVNVTLGLPIVRTSVDHGTAMDIAWKGIASEKSLQAAINMAIELA